MINHLDTSWKRNRTSKIAKVEFFDREFGCLIFCVDNLGRTLRWSVDWTMRGTSLYGREIIRRLSFSTENEGPLVYLQAKPTQRDPWNFKNGGEVGGWRVVYEIHAKRVTQQSIISVRSETEHTVVCTTMVLYADAGEHIWICLL